MVFRLEVCINLMRAICPTHAVPLGLITSVILCKQLFFMKVSRSFCRFLYNSFVFILETLATLKLVSKSPALSNPKDSFPFHERPPPYSVAYGNCLKLPLRTSNRNKHGDDAKLEVVPDTLNVGYSKSTSCNESLKCTANLIT